MKLGKLHEVDIRKVWPHEQYDFSKWLAAEENIQELGNVLNLSLTDIEKERLVVIVAIFYAEMRSQGKSCSLKISLNRPTMTT